MLNIDFDYLESIAGQIPPLGVRWGCSFDGQRLALVGYAVVQNGNHIEGSSPGTYVAETTPMIFFATATTGCSMSRAVRILDQIASTIGHIGLTLVMKGGLGRNEVFVRHLKKIGRHGTILFSEGQGRWFEEIEVMGAVADDRDEGVIRIAPEFEDRPERQLLNESIKLSEVGKLEPLQEAFVYGLGEWSCKERRRKYHIGAGPRIW